MVAPASVRGRPGDARMLDVVRRGLEGAGGVRVKVSFVRCRGLGLLIDPLREVVERGGHVRILASTYQTVTPPEALDTLRRLRAIERSVQTGAVGFQRATPA